MEVHQHVWLRQPDSHWGWVPAVIAAKEETEDRACVVLTLTNDTSLEVNGPDVVGVQQQQDTEASYFAGYPPFEVQIEVDVEQLQTADHPDIKLRNLPSSFGRLGSDPEGGVLTSPSTKVSHKIVGGVDDLIELTHLHEPAILHALRLRYDADMIYTATGPILIAVNPFKAMDLYTEEVMDQYRLQGESAHLASSSTASPSKKPKISSTLPPHVYSTADDAYRQMMRGLEHSALYQQQAAAKTNNNKNLVVVNPANQAILVSGESGAGKTVTTKIVLNYLAMLSKRKAMAAPRGTPSKSPLNASMTSTDSASGIFGGADQDVDVSMEQQVLQSNPILEAFGNARTIRNDNSSRFGKYIDIAFDKQGKLSGASIETYLLEKVRLIRPSQGERNYHIFYQFLQAASAKERQDFYLGGKSVQDFRLLSESGTFDRRDGVSDEQNHLEMLEAMITMGFEPALIQELMRLISGILFAGNMTFTPSKDFDSCKLDKTKPALACASLLGITFDGLAKALTSRAILAGEEVVTKPLTIEESAKALEALIKAVYGAAFDFIVEQVNASIYHPAAESSCASIGVLDIFGFETFQTNSFEQLCINYTNEALQQQFNRYVFKLEQQEYEKEGILWKFIAFPDNQDVLDLIDQKHTGILALLDEQCILPRTTDHKFCRYLYARCDKHARFSATSAQRVDHLFSIEHYAGYVEYTTEGWIEKNKDQLPAASTELLQSSSFQLLLDICKHVRSEDRAGRGTVATKSVSSQFSTQLRVLRTRIEHTIPHYIRCLKPNDDLVPDYFEPKNIVEQLRCGGVLEAVRVSRAGYPTRYGHDIFLARYYILGNASAASQDVASPQFVGKKTPKVFQRQMMSDPEAELKRLIGQIALQLWQVDQELLTAARQDEMITSPNAYQVRKSTSSNPVKSKVVTGIHNLPFNTVVESSVMTPEHRRRKQKSKDKAKSSSNHKVARPETKEDFLALDFSSRCAVAGLQLGRTKVFLRREAFDRMEAMRSEKFFQAVASIQKMVRGKLCREWYKQMRTSAICIQAVWRRRMAKKTVVRMQVEQAAVKIQSAWRAFVSRMFVIEMLLARRTAAIMIQRFWREAKNLEHSKPALSEEEVLKAVVGVQAMLRGASTRDKLRVAQENETTPFRKKPMEAPKPVESPPAPVALTSVRPVVDPALLTELFREIQEENWAMVESILDKNPELAESPDLKSGELALHKIARHNGAWTLLIDMVLVLYPKALIHRDNMGALPIHHAAAHDNLAALEIVYSAYKEGINDTDKMGRLPIHVAANYDAIDSIKFLLSKSPEGAYTMVYRPMNNSGGGLPLHIACRNHASIGVITALLAENFASAKRADENGDLPLHLVLRCGEVVDPVVVKTLLTCFDGAASRTDMNGDLPLAISIKHQCAPSVINAIMMQYPAAATVLNGDGHSALHLAFAHNADDRTIMGLLNHAPEIATTVDRKTGLLPIQVATENEHSHFIVHNLLKRDMPIDMKEKVRAQLIPHHYSWNHVIANTEDMYHQVVTKVLQSCTQPQVLALAHIEGPDGKIALAAATPVCKHEMRVMLRLFNTLEVVNQRPAYTNPLSDTQIFYALRYDPPSHASGAFTVLHEEKNNGGDDYLEDYDDASHVSGMSKMSMRSNLSVRTQQSIEDKLRLIRREKGQQVIAKLTSRSDVVERELRVRKDFHLSRHYVPAVISVHHTVQHAAYSEALAEPGYCITMEGADTTAENLMLDLRKQGKPFPSKALKRIGISLLHMHEHGLVHGDFGTHNIGKFGNRWKLLGVGGSVSMGNATDPNRGFYHPPEAVKVESRRQGMGNKKNFSANVVSIPAHATYDIWAFGVVVYESISGVPLGPYACRGKRAMTPAEVAKIGLWDENALKKALKNIPLENGIGRDLLKRLLHPDPHQRVSSMRHALEHAFFGQGNGGNDRGEETSPTNTMHSSPSNGSSGRGSSSSGPFQTGSFGNFDGMNAFSTDFPDVKVSTSSESRENRENGIPAVKKVASSDEASQQTSHSRSFGSLRKFRSNFRRPAAAN